MAGEFDTNNDFQLPATGKKSETDSKRETHQ